MKNLFKKYKTLDELVEGLFNYLGGETYIDNNHPLSKNELDSIKKKLLEIATELKNPTSNLNYFLIHFHHPSLTEESRQYYLFPSEKLLESLKEKLVHLIDKHNLNFNKNELNQEIIRNYYLFVHDVYFAILGRLDSISEQIYRNFKELGIKRESYFKLTINQSDFKFKKHRFPTDDEIEIELNFPDNIFIELRDEIKSTEGNCRFSVLGDILFSKIAEIFFEKRANYDELKNDLPQLVPTLISLLKNDDFFLLKESFLTSSVRKLINLKEFTTKEEDFIDNVYKYLIEGDIDNPQEFNKKQGKFKFVEVSRMLGIFQALSIYSELFGSNFLLRVIPYFLTTQNPDNTINKLLSGYAYGYDSDTFDDSKWQKDITFAMVEFLKYADAKYKESSDKLCTTTIIEGIEIKGLNQINKFHTKKELTVAVRFMELICEKLIGSTHEGIPLRFNIILGHDSYLRDAFIPIGLPYINKLKEEDGDTNDTLWSISFSDIASNEILVEKIVYQILSVYSFLQNTSNYLCFGFSNDNIVLRYIAKLNPYYSKMMEIDHTNPLTSFPSVNKTAQELKKLFYAFVNYDEAFLSYGGFINAHYKKEKKWIEHQGEDWIAKEMQKEKSIDIANELKNNTLDEPDKEFEEIIDKLLKAISLLSYTGHGTMLIIGDKEILKKYTAYSNYDYYGQGILINDFLGKAKDDEYFIYNILIRDGGILIDNEKKVYSRVFITPYCNEGPFDPEKFKPKGENGKSLRKEWQECGDYQWKDYAKWYKWGTRHSNAAALSYLGEQKVKLLTLSSDSEVHYFNGKKIIELKRNETELERK